MSGSRQLSGFIGQFSIKHRWLIWLICTLISVITATGALRPVAASDYRVFFSPDQPFILNDIKT